MVGIRELNPCAIGDTREWVISKNQSTLAADQSVAKKMDSFRDLKEKGIHFNDRLQASQQFHNPHINDKLINWAGVDEYSTNTRNGGLYSDYSHATSSAAAISALQRERANDKASSASKRANITFTPGSSGNSSNKSRKQ